MNNPIMKEALDDLKKDEIYICTGASEHYALIGEIMMARAKNIGATSTVVNGNSRVTHGMLDLDMPIFSYGIMRKTKGQGEG